MTRKAGSGHKFIFVICLLMLLPGTSYSQISEIAFYPFRQFMQVGQTKAIPFNYEPSNYSISVIECISSDTNTYCR